MPGLEMSGRTNADCGAPITKRSLRSVRALAPGSAGEHFVDGGAMTCQICGGTAGVHHRAREMMFGLRDEFDYFECGACGCLQRVSSLDDLRAYYPSNYYSFAETQASPKTAGLRRWAAERRNYAQLFGSHGIWRWIAGLRPRPDVAALAPLLADAGVRSFDARILDVGCGGGALLASMAAAGFRNLVGIDPFLAA